jgi:1-acyl-sn-glycerol-3-phosphate acyltransferase
VIQPSCLGRLSANVLRLFGWRIVYEKPPVAKSVIIVYPHTSNWDFPIGILFCYATGMPIHWAGKDTLFRWPYGAVFRRLGGFPVNRRMRTGFVGQMVDEFARHKTFYLAITPEGTRRYTNNWKSGFYRVAMAAQVPLTLGFFDYARREVGIAGYLTLSGDETVDLAQIAAVYADKRGRHPAKQGRIAFAEKDAA